MSDEALRDAFREFKNCGYCGSFLEYLKTVGLEEVKEDNKMC